MRKRIRKRKRLLPTKTRAMSAITNGKTLLMDVDGRARPARRYKDLYQLYMAKTDGRHEELCKQLASLIVQRELIDAEVMRGNRVDAFHTVRLANTINRTIRADAIGDEEPRPHRP